MAVAQEAEAFFSFCILDLEFGWLEGKLTGKKDCLALQWCLFCDYWNNFIFINKREKN